MAKKAFDPADTDSWSRYVAWSGLTQVTELITLDSILCPTIPATLIPADWEHNVHEDYRTLYFRDLAYLLTRVADAVRFNLLAIREDPTPAEVDTPSPAGFALVGFELLDRCGDISALTNCGGFPEAFDAAELNTFGLLPTLRRAREVRAALRQHYPAEPHAECNLWAVWRMTGPAHPAT